MWFDIALLGTTTIIPHYVECLLDWVTIVLQFQAKVFNISSNPSWIHESNYEILKKEETLSQRVKTVEIADDNIIGY